MTRHRDRDALCPATRMVIDRRSFVIGALASGAAASSGGLSGAIAHAQGATTPARFIETPMLAAKVAAGALPPVAERAPTEPLIVDLAAKGRAPGRHGGALRTLIAKPKNIRYVVVWGYARLLGYDQGFELQPDILRAIEVEDGRAFTLRLRAGHKWSDGAPFTAEDFRYWWEDQANHADLSPSGPPEFMKVDGATAEFSVLDETAVRFVWPAPNPLFLSELAKARPPFIYRPAHYCRQYHEAYGDPYKITAMMAKKSVRNWAQLHNRMDNMYKADNASLPTLQPWWNEKDGQSQRFHMMRNAFFHRFDAEGRQLPYADEVEMTIAASDLYPIKAQNGEVDILAKGLSFGDVPSLKRGEAPGGYRTRLWKSGFSSQIALYPNLTAADPVWRALLRDVRFRRALSMGVDRTLINETLYFGLASAKSNCVLPDSPLHTPEHGKAYAAFDPERANALLDEIGLTDRGGDGTRRMSDGRPVEMVAETAGERLEEVDALQLVTETWREIGVKLLTRPTNRDLLRNRAYSGRAILTVWTGWDLGAPSPSNPPSEVAPTRQDTLCWPAWGQHYQTQGASGEAPDLPEAQRLLALYKSWLDATEDSQRRAAWEEMLKIHADQQFVIGLLSEAPQPVVISDRLKNAPERGLYAWDPGAQFGVHRLDEWWFEDADTAAPGDAVEPAKKADAPAATSGERG